MIEAASGKSVFDATDRTAADGLIGARARVGLHPGDSICSDEPDARRAAIIAWLDDAQTGDEAELHAMLERRLEAGGLETGPYQADPVVLHRLESLLPAGYAASAQGLLFHAQPPAGSGKAVFLGALSGRPLGAAACWDLSERLIRIGETHRDSPVVLLLDAQAHSAAVADERVLLADYLVHLSATIDRLVARGQRCVLWLPGEASGAIYVAFAAPVQRVFALPSARISVLPAFAVRTILRSRDPAESGSDSPVDAHMLLEAGVVDAWLDRRLETYAGSSPD